MGLALDIERYRRTAADRLLNFKYMKEEYERIARDVAYTGRAENGGIRAGVSDPTASMAMRLDKRAGDMIKWIGACEAVFEMYGDKKRFFINVRMGHVPESNGGRPGWVVHAQKEFMREYGYNVSDKTLKRWW